MNTARSVVSAIVSGAIVVCVIGCTSPRTGVEPQGEPGSPPVVGAAPIGPPPGHVEPTNDVVRERIVLKSAPPPPAPETPVVKKGKTQKKTGRSS
jgi:hypothetical protein